MFIITQNGTTAVNSEFVRTIYVDEKVIMAYLDENQLVHLGEYKDEEAAKNIFDDFIAMKQIGRETYYMPPADAGVVAR